MTVTVSTLRTIVLVVVGAIAGIHLGLGGAGLIEVTTANGLDSILPPLFLISGIIMLAGISVYLRRPRRRLLLHRIGMIVLIGHLLFFIDWHHLYLVERALGLDALGHGVHHHGIEPPADPSSGSSLGDDLRYLAAYVAYLAREYSVLGAVVATLLEQPIALVTKALELSALGALATLHQLDRHAVDHVHWRPAEGEVRRAVIASLPFLTVVAIAVMAESVLTSWGVDSRIVDLIEVIAAANLVGILGWHLLIRPASHARVSQPELPDDRERDRAASTPVLTWQLWSGVWIGIIGLLVLASAGGIVALDDPDTGHDHGGEELEQLYDDLEAAGIDVDRKWSAMHHSDYHGGDAILLFYFTDYVNDTDGLHEEADVILGELIPAVADDQLDVEIVFVDARTPADESHFEWDINRTVIDEMIEGDRDWSFVREHALDGAEMHDPD